MILNGGDFIEENSLRNLQFKCPNMMKGNLVKQRGLSQLFLYILLLSKSNHSRRILVENVVLSGTGRTNVKEILTL